MAKVLESQDIARAALALQKGELVAIPTETVYGLAGDARNPDAVAKIFAAKARPSFDPLIVHIPADWSNLGNLQREGLVDTSTMPQTAKTLVETLIKNCWPGPLTILLPRGHKIPDIVTSGLSQVGIRCPAHPLALQLLERCRIPLAAPSANRFGRISPTTAEHVELELGDRIDWILDGGPCHIGVESTVVAPQADGSLLVLRRGGTSIEKLQTFAEVSVAVGDGPSASPGTLTSHYAPRKPLLLANASNFKAVLQNEIKKKIAVIFPHAFSKDLTDPVLASIRNANCRWLSTTQDDLTAAKNLFATLRHLDDSADFEIIVAIAPEFETGLWPAIHDRLRRASS